MRKVDSSGRAQFFPRLQKEAAHSLLFNALTPPLSLKGAVVNLAVLRVASCPALLCFSTSLEVHDPRLSLIGHLTLLLLRHLLRPGIMAVKHYPLRNQMWGPHKQHLLQ